MHGGWNMGWMPILWLVAIGALVWLVLAGIRGGRDRPVSETPEAVLKRRYAEGEIDRETYERMLADVRK